MLECDTRFLTSPTDWRHIVQTLSVNDRGYVHSELLAETNWLADRLNDPKLRLVDARPPDQFAAGHMPGAVNLSGFGGIPRAADGDMAGPEEFAGVAGSLGISNDVTVVVYDAPSQMMGMVAWAFMYYGQPGRASTGRRACEVVPRRPANLDRSITLSTGYFCSQTSGGDLLFTGPGKSCCGPVGDRFMGRAQPGGIRRDGGRVRTTGATGQNSGCDPFDWTELFDQDTNTLKPAKDLQILLASRGITPESEIDTY